MTAVLNPIRIFTASLAMAAVVLFGCQTGGQTGALAGAGIGALAGQAIGGDTGATLIGAAVGTGVGYMIGNEADKKKAAEMSRASESQGYSHEQVGSLGGTRWNLVSLRPADAAPPYSSKVVEFRADGRAITTTTAPDGTVDSVNESYRVVGSTLIVNKPGYMINATYEVSGNQLIISAVDFSAVLERLQ